MAKQINMPTTIVEPPNHGIKVDHKITIVNDNSEVIFTLSHNMQNMELSLKETKEMSNKLVGALDRVNQILAQLRTINQKGN